MVNLSDSKLQRELNEANASIKRLRRELDDIDGFVDDLIKHLRVIWKASKDMGADREYGAGHASGSEDTYESILDYIDEQGY